MVSLMPIIVTSSFITRGSFYVATKAILKYVRRLVLQARNINTYDLNESV